MRGEPSRPNMLARRRMRAECLGAATRLRGSLQQAPIAADQQFCSGRCSRCGWRQPSRLLAGEVDDLALLAPDFYAREITDDIFCRSHRGCVVREIVLTPPHDMI